MHPDNRGLPLSTASAEAAAAFAHEEAGSNAAAEPAGRRAEAVALMRPAIGGMYRLGGSHTQQDVLEQTPDFLEETPDHDRLWFEQKPPRDFDF